MFVAIIVVALLIIAGIAYMKGRKSKATPPAVTTPNPHNGPTPINAGTEPKAQPKPPGNI